MEELNIEKILQNAAATTRMDAPTESWEQIQAALHQKKKKNRAAFLLIPLLLATFLGGYWLGKSNQQQTICSFPTTKIVFPEVKPTTLPDVSEMKLYVPQEDAMAYTEENINLITKKNNFKPDSTTKNKAETITGTSPVPMDNETVVNTTSSQIQNESNIAPERQSTITTEKQAIQPNIEFTERKTEVSKADNVVEKLPLINTLTDSVVNSTPIKIDIAANKANSSTPQAPMIVIDSAKVTSPKKWSFELSFGTSFMTITEESIFNSSAEKSLGATNNFSPSSPNFTNYVPSLNALNAGLQQLSFIVNRNNKNKTIQIGAQLHYGSYNLIGYSSDVVALNNRYIFNTPALHNNFTANTTAITVPFNRQSSNTVVLKNHFMAAGLLLGANSTILSYNKKPRINAGIQLMPTTIIGYQLYYLNEDNGRLIASTKSDLRKLNLFTNFNIDYLFNLGKKKAKIGPVYTASGFSLNKKNSLYSNINVNAIGLKFGIGL